MERSDVTFWVLIHDFTCQVSLCLSLWTAFAFGEIFTWLWGEKKRQENREEMVKEKAKFGGILIRIQSEISFH